MRLLSLAAALVVGLSIADIGWAAGEDIAKYKADLASSDKEKRREAAYQLKGAGAEAKEALPALIEALRDEDKQVWSDAVAALANLGPEAAAAIPTLIEHLGGTRTGARRERDQLQTVVRSAHALSKIGAAAVPKLIPALEDESANRRAGAAKSLGGMGPVAREAVPALVERLADPDEPVRLEAAEALGLIGKAAVPALTGAVNSDDAQVRAGAAAALSGVGVDAAPAGPALLSRLETETVPVVRAAFLSALPRIGADGDATVAALLNGLDHSDESVRHAAVNALVTARTLSAKVIARVTERLNSEDVAKRESAARVLGRMGRNAADAVPALLAQARKEPANVHFPSALAEIGQPALGPLLEELQREGAAQPWVFTALRNMGSPAMGALTKQLAADSPAVRAGAARALSGMPLDGHPVLKTLNELAADPQPEVRAAVLRTLATVRTERAAVMPRLEAALQDPAGPVRTAAASGLAEMGAVAKLDAKALLELLDEMDITTQRAAIQALGALGPKAEPAVATLTAKLESPELQRAALEALGKIGPAAAPAVPQITTLAKSPNEELSLNALQALNSIGQDLAPVLPLLYEALKHQNRDLRIIAVQALPKAEKDEAKVLAALIEALDDQSGRIRRVAAEALVPYGEKGRAAIPVLLKLLDRDMERPAILTALRAMKVRDVPALLGVLENKDPATRIYACNALGELGRDAESAVPQLEKRASGDSDPVRKAAQEALKRIQQPS